MIEYIHPGRNNTIDIILKSDDETGEIAAKNLESVNRIDIVIGDITISNSTPAEWPIKWAISETGEIGKVLLLLGKNDPLPSAGMYDAKIFVYSADHPDGFYWDSFSVCVLTY